MRSFEELQSYTDRRKRERIDTALPVRFGIAGLDRTAEVGNVSTGGLYIRSNEVFPMGTRIQLAIEFPERTFHGSGEVCWAIGVPEHLTESMVYGMGVQFVELEPGWNEFFERWRDS